MKTADSTAEGNYTKSKKPTETVVEVVKFDGCIAYLLNSDMDDSICRLRDEDWLIN